MNTVRILFAITATWVGPALAVGASITPDQAATFEQAFRPEIVARYFALDDDQKMFAQVPTQFAHQHEASAYFAGRREELLGANFGYRELHFPGDPNTYLWLSWRPPGGDLYWRLLKSGDAKSFQVAQDSDAFLVGNEFGFGRLALQDLDGDGVPELLLCDKAHLAISKLYIYAWRGGRLVLISPVDPKMTNLTARFPHVMTVLVSYHNNIIFEDLDNDGKAEVVVYPGLEAVPTDIREPDGSVSRSWEQRPITPTRIYHLQNGVYTLWKEAPANDPFPVLVPDIAVLHPGTIPYSELKEDDHKAEKTDKDEGEGLRIFVSHPPGTYTVDDFDPTAFVFDIGRVPVTVKKRWENKRYPDLTQGNMEWQGCPVRQTPCHEDDDKSKSASSSSEKDDTCPRWEVTPELPTYPSPRAGTVFHFLGPYLELRAPKGSVYAFLKVQADRRFAADAAATKVFLEVPISGKMKDGKLAAIGALVCVTKPAPVKDKK